MAHSNNNSIPPNPWWTQEKIMNWQKETACDGISTSVANVKLSVDSVASTSTPRQVVPQDTSPLIQANKELLLERKEERLKNLEKKLEEEQELLRIGRNQLNQDIQRHQMLMKAAIVDLNEQVALERKRFIEEMAKEMERFKLPSVKRMMQTETKKVTGLISTANKVYQEGCDAVGWNVESDKA